MAQRAGTPPRGSPMREPPPLATVQRRARAAVGAEENNPLQQPSAKRTNAGEAMSRKQVKQMLYSQGFDLDEAYLDGLVHMLSPPQLIPADTPDCNCTCFQRHRVVRRGRERDDRQPRV